MEDRKTTTRRARPAAAKPPGSDKSKAPADAKRSKAAAAPVTADRRAWIATAAYFRAERRGFTPGGEVDDWLAAEAEIAAEAKPAATPKAALKQVRRTRKPAG
jgi:hypothetical protein